MSVTTQLLIGLVPLLALTFAVAVRPMPTPRGGASDGMGS
jgi:hypothetical protein